ncbi:MAG TPA: hypothetical protein VER32_10480 [Pyrinomonadaceae bacterium]|nr:hypothetical protein [Pyrinomonadaceae bacterium]
MKHTSARRALLTTFALALLFAAPSAAARAQREHLTPEEVELVRDNQELEKRTGIFVKAIERRLVALGVAQTGGPQKPDKDAGKWGVLPTSTRAQLLQDIAKILDEASVNIDDASIHAEKSSQIPKALRRLAEACSRFLPQFAALRNNVKDGAEREWLERAVETSEEVVAALSKLPAETKK